MALEVERETSLAKLAIEQVITREPILIPEHEVEMHLLSPEDAQSVSSLYRRAFARGDFFATRYSSPQLEIFNPDWIAQEAKNPDHIWVVFTKSGEFTGSTGLFFEGETLVSDETQIDFKGRGLRIMEYFFGKVVPQIEGLGIDIKTDFVLTPQSKGLRRSLQQEFGMSSLGIRPHVLVGLNEGSICEIFAAKYHNLSQEKPVIIPHFEQIYRIVADQLSLPEPEVVDTGLEIILTPNYSSKYKEIQVGARDLISQERALAEGYMPIGYDPKRQFFTLAVYPLPKPRLDFIIDEGIEANSQLVNYLNTRLYPISLI